MSAPTFTTHLIRSLFSELGSTSKLDCFGVDPVSVMPNISNNNNFASEYFLYNISRKRDVYAKDSIPSDVIRSSLGKWVDSEFSCSVVNSHSRYYSPLGSDVDLFSKLDILTRSHVSRILSDIWPDYGDADFTGGATNQLPLKYSYSAAKWIGYARPGRNQSVVPNAIQHLREVLDQNQAYARRLYRKRWNLLSETDVGRESYTEEALSYFQQDSSCISKLAFVPKDYKSVRMIMQTGEGTMLVQRMFGKAIRQALLRDGVDLSNQSTNHDFALYGSVTGSLATVDLSSASDTISQSVVKKFLPHRWYEWLDSCRDTHVRVDNHIHKLEKIASNGNGFCFELESLLFYSMTLACTELCNASTSFVSIYGDDIIVPSNVYDTLSRYFLYHGFFINNEKTFAGPEGFRESCGGHFYKGKDVTPVYIKKEIIGLQDIFHVYNQLNSWSVRVGIPIPKSLKMLLSKIPRKDRHLVPESYGSRSGLWSYVDGIILPTSKYNKGYQSYVQTSKVLVPCQKLSNRWCERTRLMAWFISANGTDVYITPWSAANIRDFNVGGIPNREITYKWRRSGLAFGLTSNVG